MADHLIDDDVLTKEGRGERGSLVSLYFLEASRHPLLSPAEEARLCRKLERCYKLIAEQLPAIPTTELTFNRTVCVIEEQKPLSSRCRRAVWLARACRTRLIERNLRLAIHGAKRFSKCDVPLSDLIQEANIGLIKAVDRFAPAKGFRFSTYAYWWIGQEVQACAERGIRAIRLPENVSEEIRRHRKTSAKLYQVKGRAPTQSEQATAMGLSRARVGDLRALMASEVSTGKPLVEDSATTFGDTLQENEALTPEYQLLIRDFKQSIRQLINELSPREKEVLTRRYGIGTPGEETLQLISESLGISRERVRQIEKIAVRKLADLYRQSGSLRDVPVIVHPRETYH